MLTFRHSLSSSHFGKKLLNFFVWNRSQLGNSQLICPMILWLNRSLSWRFFRIIFSMVWCGGPSFCIWCRVLTAYDGNIQFLEATMDLVLLCSIGLSFLQNQPPSAPEEWSDLKLYREPGWLFLQINCLVLWWKVDSRIALWCWKIGDFEEIISNLKHPMASRDEKLQWQIQLCWVFRHRICNIEHGVLGIKITRRGYSTTSQ